MAENDETTTTPDDEITNPGTKPVKPKKARAKKAAAPKAEPVKATKKTPKTKKLKKAKAKAQLAKPKVKVKKARKAKATRKTKAKRGRSALGALIVSRRAELGISTRELADKLDLTPQAVSAWENQVTLNVPARRLPLLAKALKLKLTDLQDCYFDKAA